MFHRVAALVIKEFLTLLQDRRSRRTILFPPLVQLLVFSYAANFDLNHIRYAVLDDDRSQASRNLLARFEGSPHFQPAAALSPGQLSARPAAPRPAASASPSVAVPEQAAQAVWPA
jgi:ABC-2 type transport system permease protein